MSLNPGGSTFPNVVLGACVPLYGLVPSSPGVFLLRGVLMYINLCIS